MSQEKRPPGVMLYFEETRPIVSLLSDEERGRLLMAILDYAEHNAEPVLSERLVAAWPFIKRKIDYDAETYRKKCEKASKAIQARWEKERKKAGT